MQDKDGLTKQLMLLSGIPVLIRSVLAFEKCEYINEIVIVARKEEMDAVKLLSKEYGIQKLSRIVSGGKTRTSSAMHGLEAISPKAKYIAVHDAARCLVTPDMIADVVSAAYANRAASAGCTSVDTLKRVSVDGYITETIDRSEVYRAQTPQVFDCNLYRAAVYSAGKDGILATDDNMLVERLGQTVKMVNTGEENIKITTAIDFAVAQAILEARATK
jgi:2-C-methyl-D-erythritol 4-phosphate cytidylyltransferase